ncbi:MAG: hypothetical protein ACYSW3_00320 [Planctomycetota bacterium]|jgi:hypothetical protein
MPDECESCGCEMKVASEIAFEVQPGGLWKVIYKNYITGEGMEKEHLAPTEVLAFMKELGVDEDNLIQVERDLDEARISM